MRVVPASVQNSQPVVIQRDGERISSPSVTFFTDPTDPLIPTYGHKIFLQQTPGGDPTVAFFALPDFGGGGYLALLPALIGQLSGSLFETSSASLTVGEGTRSRTVRLLVDTGAQACILSESVAADLSLTVSDPDFEVEVDWLSEPAAPLLELDAASGTNWMSVSTGELGTIIGTMSLTNGDANAIYRLRAAP